MSDEHRDLAAAAALGTLAPEESEGLEAALARDPSLADELAAYRSTVSQLEAHLARETPSYDLFSGILAQLEPRTSEKATSPPGRERRAWRRRLPAFAVGAAATAAVFALSLALDSSGGFGTPDAVASVQGTTDFAGVHGEARIYATDTPNGLLRLELADVPPPPEGEHYEVWVLRPSTGEAMEAVGVFDPTTSDVSLELGLPGAGDYAAVDISVEPDAGSPEHSGTSLAGGEFERGTT